MSSALISFTVACSVLFSNVCGWLLTGTNAVRSSCANTHADVLKFLLWVRESATADARR